MNLCRLSERMLYMCSSSVTAHQLVLSEKIYTGSQSDFIIYGVICFSSVYSYCFLDAVMWQMQQGVAASVCARIPSCLMLLLLSILCKVRQTFVTSEQVACKPEYTGV